LNQQQLQIARSALWHQTAATDPSAPLRTFDAAAQWLDEMGLCLFLPRHTQLPAPAPSFVEACSGAASVTPPPAAIAEATALATRLIDERRAIPLNLFGTFSEQPDFLTIPEVLPWIASIRGERQWKTAPGGRTAPIVLRTWEALDREGEMTAVELKDSLGRELTEAAILRALIELWTGLRATPIYSPDAPTRWTLLKNRFPSQLATGANTAQTTALSALLSFYLRSAVAATAEEAEIFLSPLTARSRIREVIHGMTASRQFGSTTVASQTLLFIEGSLPETPPEPEREQTATPQTPTPAPTPRAPFRKAPRPTKWELPSRDSRPSQDRPRAPWQKKPVVRHRPDADSARPDSDRPASDRDRPTASRTGRVGKPFPVPRTGFRGGARSGPGSASRPTSFSGQRSGARPTPFRGPQRPGPGERPGQRPGPRAVPPRGSGPRPADRSAQRGAAKPWQRRPNNAFPKPAFRKPEGEARPEGAPREDRGPRPIDEGRPPREQKPWRSKSSAPRQFSGKDRPWQKDRRDKPSFRSKPGRKFPPDRPRPDRPRPAGERSEENRPPRDDRKFGSTKFGPRPRFTGARPFAPGKSASGKSFSGKSGPGKFGPRKAVPGKSLSGKSGPGKFGPPKFGPRKFATGRPAPGKPRPSSGPGSSRPGTSERPFRPGKFSGGKPSGPGRGPRPPRPGKPQNNFRKFSPGERNPRKNRSQEENPE
jgi:23S rRNA pseudouridine2605 synthase